MNTHAGMSASAIFKSKHQAKAFIAIIVTTLLLFAFPSRTKADPGDYLQYSQWAPIGSLQYRTATFSEGNYRSTHIEIYNPQPTQVFYDLTVWSANGALLRNWTQNPIFPYQSRDWSIPEMNVRFQVTTH
jgi:hypothetical protein